MLELLRRWFDALACILLRADVPNSENVIRAIYFEVHVDNNGTLKWQAYDPTPGTDEISVMRSARLSPSKCKRNAKSFEKAPRKLYRGLAVLRTGAIVAEGMSVLDSRRIYCGHADIKTGVVTQKREPNIPRDSREVASVKAMATKLLRLSAYRADPDVRSNDWKGGHLVPPPERAEIT